MSHPTSRSDDVLHTAALPMVHDAGPDLWAEIHEEAQREWGRLESDVRQVLPAVRVTRGRTSGQHYFLFTHATFSLPGSKVDPVVAGITFSAADEQVAVDADVSGEQTGDVIWPAATQKVSKSKEALVSAARQLAGELVHSAAAIASALQDRSRMN